MAASATAQVNAFIAKFDPKMARLIRACRTGLRRRFSTANELVYDNYNFFVIGYGPTDRASDCVVSLAANSKGVGLCFIYGATLPDPDRILLGSGNQTRFVRLPDPAVLAAPTVQRLIAAAIERARLPFTRSGRGKTT